MIAPYPDELFLRELKQGHHYAENVCECLKAEGLPASLTPLLYRRSYADRDAFAHEIDLTVKGRPIDVKTTSYQFTVPAEFRFDPAMVDTVTGWEKKDPKPVAVVVVSQDTYAKFVIPASSRPRWVVQRKRDHIRGIEDDFFCCWRTDWRTWAELVEWLGMID